MAKKINLNNKDNDFIGSNKDERIFGNGGDDSISGAGGNDKISGGDGNDTLKGGAGDDKLLGDEGNDILLGGSGDDTLNGGAGDNTVKGGDGDDTVVLTGNLADATITKDGDTWTIVTTSGTTTVRGVEVFRFADGSVLEEDLPVSGDVGETFTLTEAPGEIIDGTEFNDTINAVFGAGATLNAFDDVDGDEGTDRLNGVVDGAFVIPTSAALNSIEEVDLEVEAGSTGTIDASRIGGLVTLSQSGKGALDIENLTSLQTAIFSDVVASVGFADGETTAAVTLDGVDDGSTLNVDGIDLTALTVTGSVEDDGAGGPGDLTITTTEEDTTTAANDGSNIATLTLTLTSDAIVDIDDLLATKDFTTFDASASTGDLTMDNFEQDNFLTSIKLGSGKDFVHYDTDYTNGGTGGAVVTIDVGAGNDEVNLQLWNEVENTSVTVTLGAGSDTLMITQRFENLNSIAAADLEANLASVADFSVTDDVLDLTGLGVTRTTLTNVQLTNIADEASLLDAATLAATFSADAVADVVVFNFDGSAYVLHDSDDGETLTVADGLLEVAGVAANQLDGTNFLV